jgi:hypothetical protein
LTLAIPHFVPIILTMSSDKSEPAPLSLVGLAYGTGVFVAGVALRVSLFVYLVCAGARAVAWSDKYTNRKHTSHRTGIRRVQSEDKYLGHVSKDTVLGFSDTGWKITKP